MTCEADFSLVEDIPAKWAKLSATLMAPVVSGIASRRRVSDLVAAAKDKSLNAIVPGVIGGINPADAKDCGLLEDLVYVESGPAAA